MAEKKTGRKKPIEQYEHKGKERLNNPPVGLVTPETDKGSGKKVYAYDPHLDPQLQWAGKAEHTSFEVPTVSLHVHERIDPRTIIEAVRKDSTLSQWGAGGDLQMSLFAAPKENPPLREAVDFYKHRHNWSNRLIAGDSVLVMNSLVEKEGMAGQVQMVYFDPPYGIKYGSNFQPFVNKRDVKDGKDEDLTAEPEMIKAFRDTWELGIHSYLTYLRDRLLLARELLHESGSIFVQISDENVHLVRNLMDEVFGSDNLITQISFRKKTMDFGAKYLEGMMDYLVWYAKNKEKSKFRKLFVDQNVEGFPNWTFVELPDGSVRKMTDEEWHNHTLLPKDAKVFRNAALWPSGYASSMDFPVEFEKKIYRPVKGRCWSTTEEGMQRLIKANRIIAAGGNLYYKLYFDDYPVQAINNLWSDTSGPKGIKYIVETSMTVIQRCMLMTTDPGDLVLDITCGSGTTAAVAEQWGRRWITCDTSRVAVTLAKQRLMTAVFDYYELAHPKEGVGSGFKYETVPHITLGSIANNEPPAQETLYDQPFTDNKKVRVTGPFTVEAVPAPMVLPVDSGEWTVASKEDTHHSSLPTDHSIARSGETLRQSEWRDELLRTGIRGKGGQKIEFSRVEPLPGTRWLHADGETKEVVSGQWLVASEEKPVNNKNVSLTTHHSPLATQRIVVSFGPEHAPLEQRQVALAIEEAQSLVPKPKMIIFASFQFDPEAAKDIDETNWPGVSLLKVQMNADLLTDDLKKKRASNESFWLIGQPEITVLSEEWLVDSNGRMVMPYDVCKKLSGLNSLAEINGIGAKDISLYAAISERRDLWFSVANEESGDLNTGKRGRGARKEQHGGVHSVPGNSKGVSGRIGNNADFIRAVELFTKEHRRRIIEQLRGNKQITERSTQSTIHSPLTTKHFFQIEVLGFDYYNTKTGTIESGGTEKIAMWMLDTDYDGRSLFPRQVFFPMSGEKDGWSRLAKNLKAEIDEELIEAYRGTVSLPFESGNNKRVAVKIVDDRGIESLKIMGVE